MDGGSVAVVVNVTRDTLSDTSVLFLRDVLRENLTDPQNPSRSGSEWIFKSRPQESLDEPFVILDESTTNIDYVSQGRKALPPRITMELLVWADSNQDRDQVSDEIRTVFEDRTSQDGDGVSIAENHMIIKQYNPSTTDVEIDESTGIERVKTVEMRWRYSGG